MAARAKLLRMSLHRPIGAEDEQRHVALAPVIQLGDELPPVHHRHHQIEQDDAGVLALEDVERLLAVGGHEHAVAFAGQA